jgi:hypothetical protein
MVSMEQRLSSMQEAYLHLRSCLPVLLFAGTTSEQRPSSSSSSGSEAEAEPGTETPVGLLRCRTVLLWLQQRWLRALLPSTASTLALPAPNTCAAREAG